MNYAIDFDGKNETQVLNAYIYIYNLYVQLYFIMLYFTSRIMQENGG